MEEIQPGSKSEGIGEEKIDIKTDEELKKESRKQDVNFIIAMVAVLLIFAVIIGATYYFKAQKSKNPFDRMEETLTPLGNRVKYLDEDHYTFNNFVFIRVTSGNLSLWVTQVENKGTLYTLKMRYGPLEVETIPYETDVQKMLKGSSEIFLTVDPESKSVYTIATVEVARILGKTYNMYNIPSYGAFTRQLGNATADYPIKTCFDASNQTTVMWFRQANATLIASVGNCVVVQGTDGWEVVKAADKVAYKLLGIM